MSFELNKAQQRVVEHKNGPLLVVAGAGTGKTRVIVEKICALLDEGVNPRQILALTFTEKAASEMLERVLEQRGGFELEMPIMTFNAYGESLLKEFNADAGLSRNYTLLGENAKIVFLKQRRELLALDYFSPISSPESLLPDLADYFSLLKQHIITPKQYRSFADTLPAHDEAEKLEKKKHRELAHAYEHYIRLAKEAGVIDYDDQIFRVIELLQTRPNIQNTLHNRYHTIMVDEFQDTNPMQSKLIDLLTNDEQNLIAVGDDDQSIYGFRGATLSNILNFKQRYPAAKSVALTENYRSDQHILDHAYTLIQQNNPNRLESQLHINKHLRAQFRQLLPAVHAFQTLNTELQYIGEAIAKKIESGARPGSIAILCRRNTTAQQVSEALQLAEIDHVVIGEQYHLYKTEIVRMLIEALRAITDPEASTSLYHTLAGSLFQISQSELAQASSLAKKQHSSLAAVLQTVESDEICTALTQLTQWRSRGGDLSVGRLLYMVIDESGLKDRLYEKALDDTEAARSITQLSQFFRTLKEFESIATQPTALQYLEAFPILETAGETGEDGTLDLSGDTVNVLTVHKAKGLEWETVFIPDCTEGSFPMRPLNRGLKLPDTLAKLSSAAADDHYAEERRLMYVALTRAKKELHLSFSARHYTATERKPSRFLSEMFDTLPRAENTNDQQSLPLLDIAGASALHQHKLELPLSLMRNGVPRLSVSQITTFLNCPLDFYYRFILAVPEPENHAAQYGSAVHACIELFNTRRCAAQPIALDELYSALEDTWNRSGYLSKKHADDAFTQARQTVKQFYASHQNLASPSRVEWPFEHYLKPENLIITGRLDAVFETNDGVEIRDYKTSSSVTTPEKAKSRAVSSRQLTLYALIWQEIYGQLPDLLSLEFVDTQLIGSVKKTQRGVESMRAKVAAIPAALANRDFAPGHDHTYCQHPDISK